MSGQPEYDKNNEISILAEQLKWLQYRCKCVKRTIFLIYSNVESIVIGIECLRRLAYLFSYDIVLLTLGKHIEAVMVIPSTLHFLPTGQQTKMAMRLRNIEKWPWHEFWPCILSWNFATPPLGGRVYFFSFALEPGEVECCRSDATRLRRLCHEMKHGFCVFLSQNASPVEPDHHVIRKAKPYGQWGC